MRTRIALCFTVTCALSACDAKETTAKAMTTASGDVSTATVLLCPDSGSCLSLYGKDTVYGPSIVCDALQYVVGGDSGACRSDPKGCDPLEAGSCEDGEACVLNYDKYCPECSETKVCAGREHCGKEVPTEDCLIPPTKVVDAGVEFCPPGNVGCGTGTGD